MVWPVHIGLCCAVLVVTTALTQVCYCWNGDPLIWSFIL